MTASNGMDYGPRIQNVEKKVMDQDDEIKRLFVYAHEAKEREASIVVLDHSIKAIDATLKDFKGQFFDSRTWISNHGNKLDTQFGSIIERMKMLDGQMQNVLDGQARSMIQGAQLSGAFAELNKFIRATLLNRAIRPKAKPKRSRK